LSDYCVWMWLTVGRCHFSSASHLLFFFSSSSSLLWKLRAYRLRGRPDSWQIIDK